MIDAQSCHAAVDAKDARFDGAFFIGVTSTRVYCRCVCPARVPKPANRRFFASAAAAEGAGFRPCLLCRPERAPGYAPIDAGARLAAQALARIEAGALEDAGLEVLAAELGVTDRHLRRVMLSVFGASPIALAQTHRLLTAKRLLRETRLPITEIALASGFRSVRRFNALFQERYRMAPSRVRAGRGEEPGAALTLDLASRGQFCAQAQAANAAARAIAGVELWDAAAATGARTLQIGPHVGWIRLQLHCKGARVDIAESLAPAIRPLLAGVRGALDMDTDVAAIDALLAQAGLAGDVAADAGLRLFGEIDPFETAVRTVLGQQVTRVQANALATKLSAQFGAPIVTPIDGLTRLFPTAQALAEAGATRIVQLGMPKRRAETVAALAAATAEGRLNLKRGAVAAGRAGLAEIPGIGPWTIEYVALRGLGDPDAFPAGDALLDKFIDRPDTEQWRPFRAYAAIRLWRRAARTESKSQ
jgi:AraC family transcriptional regulator of adaptative response / DNA-3-methyladenine glycosylase II